MSKWIEQLERRKYLAGDFGYVITGGGSGKDRGNTVAVDSSGNVVMAGVYNGSMDVDPSSHTYNLPATHGDDTFVAKYTSSGQLLWAAALGGDATQEIQSVAVDGHGNVFCGGYFSNTVDFDPGPGQTTLRSLGKADAFILKLSSDGKFQWVRRMGGSGDEGVVAIAADASGNVAAMGMFNGFGDYDPNAGVKTLSTSGGFDLFVTKLNSSGGTVFVNKFGGSGEEFGNAITIDKSGNVIASGTFSKTVDFNPGSGTNTLTSAGLSDVFVAKLSSSGAYVFAHRYGGSQADQGGDVRTDSAGNIYATGQFYGTVDFDPSSASHTLSSSGGSGDVFVEKMTSSGAYAWARRLGGSKTDRGTDLSIDSSGNVLITGVFAGTADFDPGSGTANLVSYNGSSDAFVAKLTNAGNFAWAKRIGGSSNNDIGEGIATFGGNIYITGAFGATVDFDPGSATASRTAPGTSDNYFLLKLLS